MNIIKLPEAEVNKERIPGAPGGFGSTLAFLFPQPTIKSFDNCSSLAPSSPDNYSARGSSPLVWGYYDVIPVKRGCSFLRIR